MDLTRAQGSEELWTDKKWKKNELFSRVLSELAIASES